MATKVAAPVGGKGRELESKEKPAIKIPRTHYIPVSKHHVIDAILRDSTSAKGKDGSSLQDLATVLGNLYSREASSLLDQMKRSYIMLNPAYSTDVVEITEDQRAAAADTFFKLFFEVLKKANFAPITKTEAQQAAEVQYMFTLPISVDWGRLGTLDKHKARMADPSMFPVLAQGEQLPDFASHFFVFHRGVSVDRRSDLFVAEKLDLLVSLGESKALQYVKKFFTSAGSDKSKGQISANLAAVNAAPELQLQGSRSKQIERINLVDTWNAKKDVVSWLGTKTTVQEPSYQRLVLVYQESTAKPRTADPFKATVERSGPQTTMSVEAASGEVKTSAKAPPGPGPLRIKLFKDVPMADMEVVYPEKSVQMNPSDKLKLGLTLLAAMIALVYNFEAPADKDIPVMSVIVPIILYAVRSYVSFRTQMDMYEKVVQESLYEKSLDNDLGVLVLLCDTVKDQEFTEALMAYYFLWKKGPLTRQQLRRQCERFLKQSFGVDASFDVDDAYQKLERLGIAMADITTDPPMDNEPLLAEEEEYEPDSGATFLFSVKRPSEAMAMLRERWNKLAVAAAD